MLTIQQLYWASRHTWAVHVDYDTRTLTVECEDGKRRIWQQSFAALKVWAGY